MNAKPGDTVTLLNGAAGIVAHLVGWPSYDFARIVTSDGLQDVGKIRTVDVVAPVI